MITDDSSVLVRVCISCPDRPGIIAIVSSFFQHYGANIVDSDQHSTDPQNGTFFMRLECQMPSLQTVNGVFEQQFAREVATPFNMDWKISYAAQQKRMAIFVSKYDHALLEVLWRWSRQELAMKIPFIISNHQDVAAAVKHFNIPFYHIPVTAQNKRQAEQQILEHCDNQVDGIILARYMQILSEEFIRYYPNQIINIHHSFLPAFVGASPYQQAYERGVKLIGATAHYVTAELDMGPIIAQDVARVSHRLSAAQLRELGQYVERVVLARAIRAHIEDRIIVYGNKTVVLGESL